MRCWIAVSLEAAVACSGRHAATLNDAQQLTDAYQMADVGPSRDGPAGSACAPSADEAIFELDRIDVAAKAYYAAHTHFPPSATAVLPGADGGACSGPGGKFSALPPASWQIQGWSDLGFEIDVPNEFTYHYTASAPTSATALAVGDLDCDATMMTYRLELGVTNGSATGTIVDPPPGSD